MPFKSEAQRRKFYALVAEKKMSPETLKHWEDATPKDAKLPEHVKKAYDLGYQEAMEKVGFGLPNALTSLQKGIDNTPLFKKGTGLTGLTDMAKGVAGRVKEFATGGQSLGADINQGIAKARKAGSMGGSSGGGISIAGK